MDAGDGPLRTSWGGEMARRSARRWYAGVVSTRSRANRGTTHGSPGRGSLRICVQEAWSGGVVRRRRSERMTGGRERTGMRDILIPGSRGDFRGRIQRRRTSVLHDGMLFAYVRSRLRRMLGTVVRSSRGVLLCVRALGGGHLSASDVLWRS